MISFYEAKKIIEEKFEEKFKLIGSEEIFANKSFGRISYENVFAKENLLNFKRCAYDGYAILEEDNFVGNELQVIDHIDAGQISKFKVEKNIAISVSTGCKLPEGKGKIIVIRKEFVKENKNKILIVEKEKNKNYDEIGSDIKKGELIVEKFNYINPQKIALLIATGNFKIKVFKKIKIGIVSTGDELINIGEKISEGKIYDSNSYMLEKILSKFNFFDVKNYGIFKDDYKKIREIFEKDEDIIITSGGTSMGEKDIAYKVVENEGEMIFHKILIKPGKPTFFGKFSEKLIFGLPGNPAGCFLIFQSLILPTILEKFNLRQISINAILEKDIKTKDRDEIIPFKILRKDKNNKNFAIPTFKHSGAISSFAFSDGFLLMERNKEVKKGEEIEIFLYEFM